VQGSLAFEHGCVVDLREKMKELVEDMAVAQTNIAAKKIARDVLHNIHEVPYFECMACPTSNVPAFIY
jgi:hypothetical protein